MNLNEITNEVLNRLLEKMQQNDLNLSEKYFLSTSEKNIKIRGYKQEVLGTIFSKEKVEECEFLVVNDLSIDEMIASAGGTVINQETSVIRDFLLRGKLVYILEEGIEYRSYKTISNPMYYKLLKEYEEKLLQYGIKILSLVALEKLINPRCIPLESTKSPQINVHQELNDQINLEPIYCSEKKLITYDLAMKLMESESLIFKNGTIITPSARDVFKENGNIIVINNDNS